MSNSIQAYLDSRYSYLASFIEDKFSSNQHEVNVFIPENYLNVNTLRNLPLRNSFVFGRLPVDLVEYIQQAGATYVNVTGFIKPDVLQKILDDERQLTTEDVAQLNINFKVISVVAEEFNADYFDKDTSAEVDILGARQKLRMVRGGYR